MGGAQQPFLYPSEGFGEDARFPTATFDPKAVTRASYEVKPKKKKRNGPLISVNRHPDMHQAPHSRSHFRPMSRSAKGWIKGVRIVQLVLRVLELVATAGLLALMIMINNVEELAGWVLRITFGVNMIHCAYAVFHLSRPAGGRTPGSSAAYHTFAGVSDLAVLPLYAYGVISVRNNGSDWGTLLANQSLLKFFVPAVYYTLVGGAAMHLVSLGISLWLGIMFRRITLMPPDMNPLEDHLTARAHKRNKSSIATSYTESEKRLSTPLEERRRSGRPYEDVSRPPSVPFMHTRHGSEISIGSSKRDSRINLPSRRYQIEPGNSPRSSANSADLKRMSAPPPQVPAHARGSYTEIPLGETGSPSSRPHSSYSPRPSSGTVASYKALPATPTGQSPQPRSAKFTEAWYASESLINRTQERNRAVNQMVLNATGRRSAYEAVDQRGIEAPDSDEENDDDSKFENNYAGIRVDEVDFIRSKDRKLAAPTKRSQDENGREADLGISFTHPNPLSAHPTPPPATPPKGKDRRPHTPFNHIGALAEVNLNDRRVSGSGLGQDIADASHLSTGAWEPRNRDSSIQPEAAFYSKPYGNLKPATPPVTQSVGAGRQVSSGNDYDLGMGGGFRRAVSGKVAEEGRAGANRHSRYGDLHDE